jgi:hypothetical protein
MNEGVGGGVRRHEEWMWLASDVCVCVTVYPVVG